jgi:hypothetical protein
MARSFLASSVAERLRSPCSRRPAAFRPTRPSVRSTKKNGERVEEESKEGSIHIEGVYVMSAGRIFCFGLQSFLSSYYGLLLLEGPSKVYYRPKSYFSHVLHCDRAESSTRGVKYRVMGCELRNTTESWFTLTVPWRKICNRLETTRTYKGVF